jgi:hypothetical protein
LKAIVTWKLLCGALVAALGLAQLSGCGQTPPAAGGAAASHEENRVNTRAAGDTDRYDLERDESRGGHTLSKHVGRTNDELRERLRRERNISAASTWSDLATAEVVVGEALRTERDRVENWKRRGYPRANLALHYDAGRPVGRSLRRYENQIVDASQAVIVLRADGPDSFYVLTTYPEARE